MGIKWNGKDWPARYVGLKPAPIPLDTKGKIVVKLCRNCVLKIFRVIDDFLNVSKDLDVEWNTKKARPCTKKKDQGASCYRLFVDYLDEA